MNLRIPPVIRRALRYLGTTVYKQYPTSGSISGSDTLIFENLETASVPWHAMRPTTSSDFIFFINGDMIEPAGVLIEQKDKDFYAKFIPNEIDYSGSVIDTSDEITVLGKFED